MRRERGAKGAKYDWEKEQLQNFQVFRNA